MSLGLVFVLYSLSVCWACLRSLWARMRCVVRAAVFVHCSFALARPIPIAAQQCLPAAPDLDRPRRDGRTIASCTRPGAAPPRIKDSRLSISVMLLLLSVSFVRFHVSCLLVVPAHRIIIVVVGSAVVSCAGFFLSLIHI